MSEHKGLHYFEYQVPSALKKADYCNAKSNFGGVLPQAKENINAPPSGLIDMDTYLRISSYKQLSSQLPVPNVQTEQACFRSPQGADVPRNNVNERTLKSETDSRVFPFLNPVRPIQDFVFIPSNTRKVTSDQIEKMYKNA